MSQQQDKEREASKNAAQSNSNLIMDNPLQIKSYGGITEGLAQHKNGECSNTLCSPRKTITIEDETTRQAFQ